MTPDNHDSVITHLEPDILECEVEWALGSITSSKASGGDAVATELLKILRGCCESAALGMPVNMSENSQWPQDWKRSVFIPIPKKSNDKECSNYCTVALISHASKEMLKVRQARLQQYMNQELQMKKLDLEKAEEPDIKLPTSVG